MTSRAGFAIELAALAVIAIAPVPVPEAWLVAIASISIWTRGRSWADRRDPAPPELVPVGLLCGVAALIAALIVSEPIAALTGRAVEWSQYTIVRGSPQNFVVIACVVAAQAVAIEMALRGWWLPRVLEIAPRGGVTLAVVASALAEAAITRGPITTRAGAFALGLGGALLYIGGGRRLAAPMACRLGFELGAVLLAALRVIG